eukprot:COSAG04_NODE_6928_length_1227_cov_1.260638_1_plen_21_part_10
MEDPVFGTSELHLCDVKGARR